MLKRLPLCFLLGMATISLVFPQENFAKESTQSELERGASLDFVAQKPNIRGVGRRGIL